MPKSLPTKQAKQQRFFQTLRQIKDKGEEVSACSSTHFLYHFLNNTSLSNKHRAFFNRHQLSKPNLMQQAQQTPLNQLDFNISHRSVMYINTA